MAKLEKPQTELSTEATEAFEIIELSIDDIDLLARAFQLIEEVCDEGQSSPPTAFEPAQKIIH